MTLTELRYVVAVAAERHFGRAAEKCFVSQPTLSVAVKKLEEELGVTLFERGSGEVSLTPVGERVVAQARRVLQEAAAVKELAAQGRDPLAGPLKLGVIYTIGPYLLPHLIPALRETAPRMPLTIEENYTDRLLERVRAGELDVVVIATPVADPTLVSRALYDEPFVVAVSREHPWARRRSIASADLLDEELLLLGSGHCFRDQVLAICPALSRGAAPSGSLRKALEGSSLETIRHMVASGMGLTVLPCTSLPADQEAGLLRFRPFNKPVPDRRVALVWRRTYPRPEAVEAVRQAVLSSSLPCVRFLDLPADK